MKRFLRSKKRSSEEQPRKGNHNDGAGDVRRHRSEQRAKGRERSGAASSRVAGVHRKYGTWWPLANYKIGKANAVDAMIEPRVGGRWYERGDDGSTCDWGRVLSWEPPSRLVLSWDISADWQFDPDLKTEIEIRFIAEGKDVTRVELEHRKLDRYGPRRDEMRHIFDTEGDWGRLLQMFAARAAAA
jgi:uncharacterized protein YndB with AHSA1/START domain